MNATGGIKTMEFIYICPKCKSTYGVNDKNGMICSNCGCDTKYSGYTDDQWYSMVKIWPKKPEWGVRTKTRTFIELMKTKNLCNTKTLKQVLPLGNAPVLSEDKVALETVKNFV